jgi:general secretion pathway protein B
MSYILDAIKKAERDRNLGTIPTIHAQAVPGAASHDRKSIWRSQWLWIVLCLMMLVLIVFAWFRPAKIVESSPKPIPELAAPIESPVIATPPLAAAAPEPMPAKPKQAKEFPVTASPPVQKKPAPAPIAAKPSEENSVPTLRELPEQIQLEIPQLAVGGYIYSQVQAERFILVNKKLLHEGDQLAPDLTLEKMLPNGLIFNYKGYRYRTSY